MDNPYTSNSCSILIIIAIMLITIGIFIGWLIF